MLIFHIISQTKSQQKEYNYMKKGSDGKLFLILVMSILVYTRPLHSQTTALNAVADVDITINSANNSIVLYWQKPGNTSISSYRIFKKLKNGTSWNSAIKILPASERSFVDTDITKGVEYEYYIESTNANGTIQTQSYLSTGIDVAINHQPGLMLILIDSTLSPELNFEITRLKNDLIQEGWRVTSRNVSRTESVTSIKSIIQNTYTSDNSLKSVLLIGYIAVPYSGDRAFDGHSEHTGSWATDSYYADLDGAWTDISVNLAGASRSENKNVPGDGKFDQSSVPSKAEISVGRVDFSDLSIFSETEIELTKRYLDKNHRFRTKQIQVIPKATVDDNFTSLVEAFNGWSNFYSFFEGANVQAADFIAAMRSENILWSYGSGGGSYTSCSGVGSSADFTHGGINATFLMNYGSYYADFDTPNNFMRSSLAAQGNSLVNIWGGVGAWLLHPMALGETIGSCYLKTLNNTNSGYYKRNSNLICMNLHGDPSLKQYIVSKPADLVIGGKKDSIVLSWRPSTDNNIIGYAIYRSHTINGSFSQIEALPNDTLFVDKNPLEGQNVYLVRAIKRELNSSGSFINYSQGVLDSIIINREVEMRYLPVISIKNLITKNYYSASEKINIQALCHVKNSRIKQVEIYLNDVIINTKYNEPFLFEVENTNIGLNKIKCVAEAESGLKSTSETLALNVASADFKGSGTGLKATYYNDIELKNPIVSRLDSMVSFQWAKLSPSELINVDQFSVKWEGEIEVPFSEMYSFITRSDDGARVYINDSLVVNGWFNQGITSWTGNVQLISGKPQKIEVQFYDYGGGATMELYWKSKNQNIELIKPMFLYPKTTTHNHNNTLLNTVKIYPNPTTDKINIIAPNQPYKIAIYESQTGRLMVDQFANRGNTQVSLTGINPGLYIVCVYLPTSISFTKLSVY